MKNHRFVLTRKNQKGQVAIFVALIFQVIFVFFAILINVGLLVHHKINLQQSADMAAYYGAMKQAEMLNVMSHINFQIRQAWKLMTWRYRVLGTFRFNAEAPSNPSNTLTMPIRIGPEVNSLVYYDPGPGTKCANPPGINVDDVPIYCIAHSGFGDWSAPAAESPCKVSCPRLDMVSRAINKIPTTSGVSVPGASVAGSVNQAINATNTNAAAQCENATKVVSSQFINLLTGYFRETQMRSRSFNLLAKNLMQNKDKFLDLEGKKVFDGVKKTFENNLTEANLTSLKNTDFSALNGLSIEDNPTNTQCDNMDKVFNKIKFELIQYFLSFCAPRPGVIREDFYMSPYDLAPSAPAAPSPAIQAQRNSVKNILTALGNPSVYQTLMDLLSLEYTVGYEKNPYCQSYYSVRARSRPKIPFLPISQVELTAVAVAKPFGGSIGPWYYKQWKPGEYASDANLGFDSGKVDKVLPNLKMNAGSGGAIKENISLLPNFSLFVGDTKGLSDRQYLAVFQDFLLNRNLQGTSSIASASHGHSNPSTISGITPMLSKPDNNGWPLFKNWTNISKFISTEAAEYDPLAFDNSISKNNSRIRDLEIAAIAPNNFDLSYYSIDSDFYKNYFEKYLSKPSFVQALRSNNSEPNPDGETEIKFLPDFGYTQSISGIPEGGQYSVRHQLAVVEQIFKQGGTTGMNQIMINSLSADPEAQKKYFTYIPKMMSSLLTGWTFKNLTNEAGYTDFPSDGLTNMAFGQCKGDSNNVEKDIQDNYLSITKKGFPANPGNCVTGGRTGYSVKIISTEAINGVQGNIGLGGGGSPMLNPLPESFINF